MKKVVISCGPIPAKLDSVKFITNRFKGGLAFQTAAYLASVGHDVTIITWAYTQIPDEVSNLCHVTVDDVTEYYNWYFENASKYDAFIMAAAVANLMPSSPYEGKFPSHKYQVGEKFNIEFEIAPRAIDIIKKLNPRACLIGYKLFDTKSDEELIEIGRHTLMDSKANIIFANTPTTAKYRKIALMADGATIPCNFYEHMELIDKAINADYFKTEVSPLEFEENNNPHIRMALAIVKLYEQTFINGFGTVAVPVHGMPGAFATTARGHNGSPVLVRAVDYNTRTVYASGKATLNAPTLCKALELAPPEAIILHRHENDPRYLKEKCTTLSHYCFPGTTEEVSMVANYGLKLKYVFHCPIWRISLPYHGDLRIIKPAAVDWNQYYMQFPKKYFSIPAEMQLLINAYANRENTLELGANRTACTTYSYDPFVQAKNAINLSWDEVIARNWDFVVAKNSINYFAPEKLKEIVNHAKVFVANTFITAPEEKITECEAAVLFQDNRLSGKKINAIKHALLLPDDSLLLHSFYAYNQTDFEKLGLHISRYGTNSALVTKGTQPYLKHIIE